MIWKKRWNVPIPEGYRIYQGEFDVAGTQHHKKNLLSLMDKGEVTFSIHRDVGNQHHTNAISIVASYKGWFFEKEKLLGYVPATIADQIVGTGVFEHLTLRPKAVFVSDSEYVELKMDLLGPKSQFNQYSEYEPSNSAG